MLDAPIESVGVSAYTIPTDAPEADGTLAWDSTTMVLVEVRSGHTVGTGWTYAPAACGAMVAEMLAGIVRGRDALDVGGAFDAMVNPYATRAVPESRAMRSRRSTWRFGI